MLRVTKLVGMMIAIAVGVVAGSAMMFTLILLTGAVFNIW